MNLEKMNIVQKIITECLIFNNDISLEEIVNKLIVVGFSNDPMDLRLYLNDTGSDVEVDDFVVVPVDLDKLFEVVKVKMSFENISSRHISLVIPQKIKEMKVSGVKKIVCNLGSKKQGQLSSYFKDVTAEKQKKEILDMAHTIFDSFRVEEKLNIYKKIAEDNSAIEELLNKLEEVG